MPKQRDIDTDLPVNTGELIARICKAASERWPDDGLKPGIQIAHLPANSQANPAGNAWDMWKDASWYVALHRYPRASVLGSGAACNRIVQLKTQNADLDLALLDIAQQLQASCVVVELRELEELLSKALKAVS